MARRFLPNLTIIAILGLGLLARLAPLGLQRFHEDEALYSSWGLRIAGGDIRLAEVPVDKPPLFFYLQAGSFALFGPSETTARLPSLLASVAGIGLLYLLARLLYDQPTALVATALFAASPFAISFAPTAFLDPLMGMWVLAACMAAAHGRWGWAGMLMGLAEATKWEGVAFLPLVVGLGLGIHPVRPSSAAKGLLRAALGLLAILALIWDWDLSRPQPSILHQLRANYGGLAPSRPEMWGGRLRVWANQLRYAFYHPWLNVLFLAGLPLLVLADVRELAKKSRGFPQIHTSFSETADHQLQTVERAPELVDLSLLAFLSLFLTSLALMRIPIWDRYLLALVPFGCLLLARILWLPSRVLPHNSKACFGLSFLIAAMLLFTLPLPMRDAAAGRFPLGGDHGTYQGIEQVVAYFRGHVMGGAILYHRWLGNHYRFYMFRFPYSFRWWRTPEELAQDAAAASDVERWIVFPSWHDEGPARRALAARGLRLIPRHRTYRDDGSLSFTIYQIEGP